MDSPTFPVPYFIFTAQIFLNLFPLYFTSHVPAIQVEIITLSMMHATNPSGMPFVGPAFDMADKDLRETYPLLNISHTYLFDRRFYSCVDWAAESDAVVARYIYTRKTVPDVTAFILAGCSDVAGLQVLAKQWNMLVLTSTVPPLNMQDKAITPTCITLSTSASSIREAVYLNLMKKFGWSSFFIVTDKDSSPTFSQQAERVRKLYNDIPGTQTDLVAIWPSRGVDYIKILRQFWQSSRVCLYFGHSIALRSMLIQAARLNMTNGEYKRPSPYIINVFMTPMRDQKDGFIEERYKAGVGYTVLSSLSQSQYYNIQTAASLLQMDDKWAYIALIPFRGTNIVGNLTWQYHDQYDQIAKSAFRSLLVIEPDQDVYGRVNGSNQFLDKWKADSIINYGLSYEADETVAPNVASTYAAMMIFGEVTEEIHGRFESFDFSDGTKLAKQFMNRSFSLKTGAVFIDQVGERLPVILITDMNTTTGEFEPVMLQSPTNLLELTEIRAVDWPGHTAPPNEPKCGYRGDDSACALSDKNPIIYGSTGGAIFAMAVVTVLAYIWIKKTDPTDQITWWDINPAELINRSSSNQFPYEKLLTKQPKQEARTHCVIYQNNYVWLNCMKCGIATLGKPALSKNALIYLQQLKEISNGNINGLVGISCWVLTTGTSLLSHKVIVSQFCAKSSVDVLTKTQYLDYDLQISLIMDFLSGVIAIHQSSVKVHGNLTIYKCLVDSRFTLKIGKFGYDKLWQLIYPEHGQGEVLLQQDLNKLVYVAPELLRREALPSFQTDMFSIGVILNQILTLSEPYEHYVSSGSGSLRDAIQMIKLGALSQQACLRPLTVLDVDKAAIIPIIKRCWHESPILRGTAATALRDVEKVVESARGAGAQLNMFENILCRLEKYASELDQQVYDRTQALITEKEKCDDLLREMLPGLIVSKLRSGQVTEPEMFASATIFFSHVEGFERFSTTTASYDVMDFLNDIYTVFDNICSSFDVYKVETVADSYMVSSGIPERNGTNHIKEISLLALTLMHAYKQFSLSTDTALCIGIHTGSCAAGVVGQKTPRYCLFGDTVNTAARMLMYGDRSKIHLSFTAADHLRSFTGFTLTERGLLTVKGKGLMLTYWLDDGPRNIAICALHGSEHISS